MTYLHNKNKKIRRSLIFFAIVLLAFIFLFNGVVSRFASVVTMPIVSPFFKFGNFFVNLIDENLTIFREKKNLLEENDNLKQNKEELESKIFLYESERNYMDELKNFFSNDNKVFFLSFVLSRPPQSPYDILIINSGSDDGIQKGTEITAYGNILLGYVVEVFSKTSKVKLISFPGEEVNAVLSSANVPVIVVGKGSGSFEIKLPRAIEVNTGEKITTLGSNPLLIGIAEKIEMSPADPFQKIIFRFPINLQELKYVMVKK